MRDVVKLIGSVFIRYSVLFYAVNGNVGEGYRCTVFEAKDARNFSILRKTRGLCKDQEGKKYQRYALDHDS